MRDYAPRCLQQKYVARIKTRYLIYTKDLRKDGDVICLPISNTY